MHFPIPCTKIIATGASASRARRCLFLASFIAVAAPTVRPASSGNAAFVPRATPLQYNDHHQTVSVRAAGGFGGSGSGGGFGSPKKDGKKKGGRGGAAAGPARDDSKVRTVSGSSGSGAKPLRVAANTFDSIFEKYGAPCVTDLYVRSPANEADTGSDPTFWFVGKVAADPSAPRPPTVAEAVLSQKRLILEYAKRELRPQNFVGKYSEGLQVWTAPGNSEMDVVQNKAALERVAGSTADIAEDFDVRNVGFNPEIYVGDEIKDGGLRVVRDEAGKPVKPVFEIND